MVALMILPFKQMIKEEDEGQEAPRGKISHQQLENCHVRDLVRIAFSL
jgi:hypothetical protein